MVAGAHPDAFEILFRLADQAQTVPRLLGRIVAVRPFDVLELKSLQPHVRQDLLFGRPLVPQALVDGHLLEEPVEHDEDAQRVLAAVQQGGETRMGGLRLPAGQVVQHVEDGGHGIPDAQALDVGPLDDPSGTGMKVQFFHLADDEFHVAAEPFGEILDGGPVESVPFRVGIALQETHQCFQTHVLK